MGRGGEIGLGVIYSGKVIVMHKRHALKYISVPYFN